MSPESPQIQQPQPQEQTRDLDPNVRQRRASNPHSSVWVGASAGTGKTKVLTDRVLRLLLPRENGAPGTPAHKILGITFTKAAASEMALRINETLGTWAVMPETELFEALQKLQGRAPKPAEIKAARQLFADVVDTPGGLKIMTIHAFCQSLLSRFPLEAGLPPYFSVIEEAEAAALLERARNMAFTQAQSEKTSPLHEAFITIAGLLNEDQFSDLMNGLIGERYQFTRLLEQHGGLEHIHLSTCAALGIQPDESPAYILRNNNTDTQIDTNTLRDVAEILSRSTTKGDLATSEALGYYIASNVEERMAFFDDYRRVFFTQAGERRKKLVSKSIAEKYPKTLDILDQEAVRVQNIQQRIQAAQCTYFTRDLLIIGQAVLAHYQNLKASAAMLDFDDLILKTRHLIAGAPQNQDEHTATHTSAASWVLYKLDQGLDHVLVDEAQDTNPDQWSIIEGLCAEFFEGAGARDDLERTLFVVGDEKQSIYSFQRASPQEFARMQAFFADKITKSDRKWENIALNISFRSAKTVLESVDHVFLPENTKKGLTLGDVQHHSFRIGQAGHVELWPIFEPEAAKEALNPWDPPTEIIDSPSGAHKFAAHIADTIAGWLENGEELPARGRAIEAGDIMILVRTRNAFVAQLSRALKQRGIPLSGADRMVLNDQLVVEDLLALARFALMPADDLTLACILKSPMTGMEEEALFALCHGRSGTLWEALQEQADDPTTQWLKTLISHARRAHPYEFFTHILHTPCPADDHSGLRAISRRLGDEALDPLQEFLAGALHFEQTHTPSLQGFVQWQSHQNTQVKREMEDSGGQVRIMTVHGSKGLQAPIVILPDTLRTMTNPPGQVDRRLLWPDKSGLSIPLWSPRKDYDCDLFTQGRATVDERLDEEYRRLLYVAMTRAEDKLYVGGYQGVRKPLENSWYHFVKAGLEAHADTQTLENGTLRLTHNATRDGDRVKPPAPVENAQNQALPAWIANPAPTEPHPPAPLRPSRPSEAEPAARSPLEADENSRFIRGNLTHKLLEILPELPPENRARAGEIYLAKHGSTLKDDIKKSILSEALAIFDHKEFAPLFGPNARAEVPLSGLMKDGRIINGQIDRLLVTDTDILIVDYKSNRPPPTQEADIPPLYRAQLQAYADTLRAIYPNHNIHAALLWTDGPHLMPVPLQSEA